EDLNLVAGAVAELEAPAGEHEEHEARDNPQDDVVGADSGRVHEDARVHAQPLDPGDQELAEPVALEVPAKPDAIPLRSALKEPHVLPCVEPDGAVVEVVEGVPEGERIPVQEPTGDEHEAEEERVEVRSPEGRTPMLRQRDEECRCEQKVTRAL